MTGVYFNRDSWAHRLPAGLKLLAVAVASVLLFRADALWVFTVALVGVVGLYATLGRDGLRRLSVLRPLAVMVAILVSLHWMSGTAEVGLVMAIRLTVMVLAANLVSITTRLDDMMDAVEPLFRPLKWIGIPPRVPALAVMLVLRFAPVLVSLYGALREAYRARTGRAGSWRLLAPFFLQALRASENVAEALTARGGAAGLSEPRGQGRGLRP